MMSVLLLSSITMAQMQEEGKSSAKEESKSYRHLGLQYYRSHDYKSATRYFAKAAMIDPSDADNHAYLANSVFKQGKVDLAKKGYQKAIELDATQPRFYSNLGLLYVESKNYEAALETFQKAMELAPEDGTFKKNRDGARIQLNLRDMVSDIRAMNYTRLKDAFTGRDYSNEVEITLRMAVEEFPEVVAQIIEVLQSAIEEVPDFAISRHVLANTYMDYIQHRETGIIGVGDKYAVQDTLSNMSNKKMKKEAEKIIVESLEVEPRFNRGGFWKRGKDKEIERMCVTDNCKRTMEEDDDEAKHDETVKKAKLRVVCVSTAMRSELKTLIKSAEELGFKFDVLGMNTKWMGLGSKVTMFADYLKDVDDNELVLFVDAFDVLLLPDAANIARIFADSFTAAKVVLGGEKACSPDKSLTPVFPDLDYNKPFQFLNSGSYIGLVKNVKMMLEDVSSDIAEHHAFTGASPMALDDQRWFTRYYLRNPGVAQMDVEGVMFHTLHDIEPEELSIKKDEAGVVTGLNSNVTGVSPCLIHGNGGGLTTFHVLVNELIDAGWPATVTEEEKLGAATTSVLRG